MKCLHLRGDCFLFSGALKLLYLKKTRDRKSHLTLLLFLNNRLDVRNIGNYVPLPTNYSFLGRIMKMTNIVITLHSFLTARRF